MDRAAEVYQSLPIMHPELGRAEWCYADSSGFEHGPLSLHMLLVFLKSGAPGAPEA